MLYYILLFILIYSPATFAAFSLGTHFALFRDLIAPFSHDDATDSFAKLMYLLSALVGVIAIFSAATSLKQKPARNCQNLHVLATLGMTVGLVFVTKVSSLQGFLGTSVLLAFAAYGTQAVEVILRVKVVRKLYDLLLPLGTQLESATRRRLPTRLAGWMTVDTYLYVAYTLSSFFYTFMGYSLGKDILGEVVPKLFLGDETTEQYYTLMAIINVLVALLAYVKYKLPASFFTSRFVTQEEDLKV